MNNSKVMSPVRTVTTAASGDWRIAKKLLPYLAERWRRVAIALVLLVLARLANVSIPLILKRIVDDLGEIQAAMAIPLALLLGYGLFWFASILFAELRNAVFYRIGIDIICKISSRVFRHLHQLSLKFHLERKIGALFRDIDRGNQAISRFLIIIVFSIVPVMLEMTLVIGILWNQLGIQYALLIIILVIAYVVYTLVVTRWRRRFQIRMNEQDSHAGTRLMDSLMNFETVKVFGNEDREQDRYDRSMRSWGEASYRNNLSLSLLNAGQGLIIAIGLAILMVMAATGVRDEILTVGDFVMLHAFLLQLYVPLNVLGSVYREMNNSLIDMDRMFQLLDEEVNIKDKPNAGLLRVTMGGIEFRNVDFSYSPGRKSLSDISLRIPGGRQLAIVGPSGAGKSTLGRLLLRFYEPQRGQILVDGQDIRDVSLASLREVIGIVPQDTVLFNDTIRYNIGYGDPDAGIGAIEEAARIAQIHDFVQQHPDRYEALVGERGLKLSGGEKQRMAIARTALKKARILIFDEATSSLDSRAENAIVEAMDRVSQEATTLIIAHRLSTVVGADEILVLDQGRIVERGSHATLLSNQGLYAQMWELQQQSKSGADASGTSDHGEIINEGKVNDESNLV
ncbi:MAG: ABC transporter ATP-binding protein/permease [Gammaproteobacteria bacterium]|nr:ABC transporter ATP-binding protein/permease [Gammaproteobacteria bacterium]